MVVQHNLTAMNSNRMLGITTGTQAKSTEKLSSGYKINRAADDAAGLSISEKMRKQIRGLSQASLNAEDGISAVQTAEGALNEVQDMLQRMNELAVKAANGTMSEDDRSYIQNEIDQLVTEIDRVSETTKFNETYLLKGSKEESDMPDVSAVVGGTVKEGVSVAATGNLYEAAIVDGATNLASGTKDVATISYLDSDGNTREKEIEFIVGADAEATAENLAKAINNDKELSKVFIATADEDGKFSVESKLDGTKTDDTKNAVQTITFESDGGALETALVGDAGTTTAATSGSYEIALGSADSAGDALATLTTGSSVTIDGTTYTFDAAKNNSADTHSFSTLNELQNLLGDSYEVSVKVTATAEHDDKPAVQLEKVVDAATAADDVVNAIDDFDTDIADDQPEADYSLKAGSVTASLVITKKADPAKEINALTFSLQVGADTTEENKISVDIESMSAKSLGIDGLKVDGKTSANADAAVNTIAAAIQKVSTQRSALGAVQNRLEHTIANLDNVVENTTAAESQIRDTDMATEMVKYSNNNILAQAGQAMLAQANQANQGVLSLLG